MKQPHHHPYALDEPWSVGAVILGAGRGERLGHGPKALLDLGGRPLLLSAVRAMSANRAVSAITVTAPDDLVRTFQGLVDAAFPDLRVEVVAGGPTRQASSHAGLTALPPAVEWVAVTDVARPLTPHGTVDRLLDHLREVAARSTPPARPCGVVPALPLADSVHLVDDTARLARPVDRDSLRAAQTPQVFHRRCLEAAHRSAADQGLTHTDEAGMAGHIGAAVITAPGDPTNFKITFPDDLLLARALHAYRSHAPDGDVA